MGKLNIFGKENFVLSEGENTKVIATYSFVCIAKLKILGFKKFLEKKVMYLTG